jgi:hypothetical protein
MTAKTLTLGQNGREKTPLGGAFRGCVLRQPFGILDMDADFSTFERRPQKRAELRNTFPGWLCGVGTRILVYGSAREHVLEVCVCISRAYSPLTQDLDDYVYLAVLRYFFISHS